MASSRGLCEFMLTANPIRRTIWLNDCWIDYRLGSPPTTAKANLLNIYFMKYVYSSIHWRTKFTMPYCYGKYTTNLLNCFVKIVTSSDPNAHNLFMVLLSVLKGLSKRCLCLCKLTEEGDEDVLDFLHWVMPLDMQSAVSVKHSILTKIVQDECSHIQGRAH